MKKQPTHNQQRAYLLALSAITFWATMGTAFKLTLAHMSPEMLVMIASLISLIVLFAILLYKKQGYILWQLTRRQFYNSALMGLFNPFLYYLTLLNAYSRIPAQEGVALNYIWPLMLVIFSVIFLKQPIRFGSILAILLSFAGTVIIATHGNLRSLHFSNPLGVALALSSALFWASFWIINMKDSREALPKMTLNFAFGALYITVFNIITHRLVLPDIQGIAGAVYIGAFEMGLTFVLWLTALQYSTHTARVSNLVYLSPFISLFLIALIVKEKILPSTWIGLIIIVAGIALQQYVQYRDSKTRGNLR